MKIELTKGLSHASKKEPEFITNESQKVSRTVMSDSLQSHGL